jgi:hypothetical protein
MIFFRKIQLIFVSIFGSILLASCGGGESEYVSPEGAIKSLRVQAALINGTNVSATDAATQLMDFAENSFSEYFPERQTNSTDSDFVYRYYPATQVYLGVALSPSPYIQGNVYVVGPPFGNTLVNPQNVGPITKFITVGNAVPVANAGLSQNVVVGSAVTLNGGGSSDANGDLLTYSWTLISKPVSSRATIIQPTSVKSSFTADLVGTYIASLIVSDGKVGGSKTATTKVISVAAPTPLQTSSPYFTFPSTLDESLRLTNVKAELAFLASESVFSASPVNDYGWKFQATYAKQGLFRVPVMQGYFYQFSTSSFWGPCIGVYDEAGFQIGSSCAPASSTVSSTRQQILAAKSGFLYVDVTSRISPSFKNADLVIHVNPDSKGLDGGQQVNLSSFATGPNADLINFGFYGGSGNDQIIGKPSAKNTIYGGAGDDIIEIKSNGYQSSFADGGSGVDTVVVGIASGGVTIKRIAAFGYESLTKGASTDAYHISKVLLRIRNIERIQFTDKTLDVSSIPGY